MSPVPGAPGVQSQACSASLKLLKKSQVQTYPTKTVLEDSACEFFCSGLLLSNFVKNPEQKFLYIFPDSFQTVCLDYGACHFSKW